MMVPYDQFALVIYLFFIIFSNYVFAEAQSPADSPISPEQVSSPAPQTYPPSAPRKVLTPDSVPTSSEDPSDGMFDAISELPLSSENLPSASSLTDMLKDSPLGNLVSSVKFQTTFDPELKKICDATNHPPLCMFMVSSHLQGKVDVRSVLEVSMKVFSEHVKLAIGVADKLIGAHSVASPFASKLRNCMDSYHDASDNLEKAIDAVSTLDIGAINSMLTAVMQDTSQCVDAFAGENFSLPDSCQQLTKMAHNCLAIAALIK